MGYAQRQREEAEALHVAHYRVRRWTAFEYSCPEGVEMRTWRKDVEHDLKRSASLLVHALRKVAPDGDGSVTQVRVGGKPELLFEMTVRATDEEDARKRAMYRFARALAIKVPIQGTKRSTTMPPWGKADVDEVRPNSRRKLRAVAG